MVEDIATGCDATADETARLPEAAAPSAAGLSSRPLPLGAALAASAAALAACGGGGGGGSGGIASGVASAGPGESSATTVQAGSLSALASTPTAQTYVYTQAKTDEEAARFLLQSQFSASEADIAAVRSKGYLPWLGEQVDRPAEQGGRDWILSKAAGTVNSDDMIWNQLMTAPDGLRKRMALVFSEIFVVSRNDIGSSWPELMMAQYWDTLVAGVTTNFRKLLEDVTLNPAMGYYLNTRGNQKENAQGRQPDENYAREVMQLMTIGLYQLDADGSVKTGGDGAPLDSYSLDDVTNLARVFTGYDLDIRAADVDGSAWTARPMALTASRHSVLEARFLGASVPAGTEGKAALKIALDTLFNHPNVGPFIGKQLIQRLVTSNPSPAYVGRVAAKFNDNGSGVRGDMKAVWKAILTDPEARTVSASPSAGKITEPVLRLSQMLRAFGATSVSGRYTGIGLTDDPATSLGQTPMFAPTVFNFFRPGYVPTSQTLMAQNLVVPEMQIVTDVSVAGYMNYIRNWTTLSSTRDIVHKYDAEQKLADTPAALVDRMNLLLFGGTMPDTLKTQIATAVASRVIPGPAYPPGTAASAVPTTTPTNQAAMDAARLERVYLAVFMSMASPDYLVQK